MRIERRWEMTQGGDILLVSFHDMMEEMMIEAGLSRVFRRGEANSRKV